MKKNPTLFILAMVVILVAGIGFAGTGKQELRVKTATANIRSKPQGEIIKQVPQGTLLECRGTEGEWYKVDLPSGLKGGMISGYIYRGFVEFVTLAESDPRGITRKPVAMPFSQTPMATEKKFAIDILGGGGATFVDIAKDMGVDESWLMDWTMVNWRVTVQGLYQVAPMLEIGGEVGFDTLYYVTWQSPSVSYSHFVTVTATNIHLLAEYDFAGSFFAQAGVGAFIYSESTGVGFLAALGGRIPISDVFSLPVMVRFDAVPGYAMPLTVMLGLRIKAF